MGIQEDRAYYAARAETERRAAAGASDPVIARVHLELAEAYERRLRDDARLRVEPMGDQPAFRNVIPISQALNPPA